MRKRSLVLRIGGIAAAVLLLAAAWIRLPYYSEGPGEAREVVPLISVEGHTTYDTGRLVMTTVEFRHLTAIGALLAWVDADKRVVGQDLLYTPGETVAQEQQRSLSQMDTSKLAAASVVLTALTDYRIAQDLPDDRGDGVLIETVFPQCPAEDRLFSGDLVDAINGTPIHDVPDASAAIEAVDPGDPLTFHVSAGGEEHDVTVTRGDCPGADRPVVGIAMVNDFPFDVEIQSGDVGGPSAGLMFGLGLYDLLTPGDLTGGELVAGTGTMQLDGSVGPIGGIGDKIVAAQRVGADLFLVPKDDLAEARTADAGDMRLVGVGTFEDALAALGVTPPSGTAGA